MAITSSFANLATVTRASKKTDAGGWDFTSGGTVGALSEYASNVAAIHATAGALVEESTTNHVANPRCEGSTAGDISGAGVLPTGWSYYEDSAVVTSVVGTGSEDGWPYIDISYVGTAAGAEVSVVRSSGVATIAALTTEVFTSSMGFKIVSGDLTNVTSVEFKHESFLSGSFVDEYISHITPTSTHKRYVITDTMDASTIDTIAPSVRLIFAAGAVNLTLRYYCPQCEKKSYPTSPVLPTVASPAASTRAADTITIANGSWAASGANGSMYVEFVDNVTDTSDYSTPFAIGVDANNQAYPYVDYAAGNVLWGYYSGGVFATFTTSKTHTAGATNRAALGWELNNIGASIDGGTASTDASQALMTGTLTARIGARIDGAVAAKSMYVRDVRYWPRRLTDAELEAVVGN